MGDGSGDDVGDGEMGARLAVGRTDVDAFGCHAAGGKQPRKALAIVALVDLKGLDQQPRARNGAQHGGPLVKRTLSRLAGVSLYWLAGLPTHGATAMTARPLRG